ncbi:MAG: hypothetical protein ACRELA_03260 [Candidatus Rokuibacteriota bacterium]
MRETTEAARALGVTVSVVEVRGGDELPRGFADIKRQRPDAVYVPLDALFFNHRLRIAELALTSRLATIADAREFVEAGGLMAYGTANEHQGIPIGAESGHDLGQPGAGCRRDPILIVPGAPWPRHPLSTPASGGGAPPPAPDLAPGR